MPSNAISSHGTLLQMGDAAPGTYATIGEVLDIKGPEIAPVFEEATNQSSGGWAERKPVLMDGGKLTCKINYVNDATQNVSTGLRAAMFNKTLKYFKTLYPDSTGETFAAYVKINREAKVKGFLQADVELTITGAVTPF
jgi:hypothetical protein